MKLLLHDNIASHYRTAIFQLMDRELGCDFCFGDKVDDIKKMDYSFLSHHVTELHNVFFPRGYWQKGMLRMLRADYDTYIMNGEPRCVSSWLFLLIRKLFYRRKKVYFWAHGMLGKESGLKKAIARFRYGLIDGAFVYNERSCRIMSENGIPSAKLHPIYNSLDYDAQLPLRKSMKSSEIYKEHFGNNIPVLIFIGRLTAVKKLNLVIEAVSHLKQQGLLANLVFVGDGTERGSLESLVEQLGVKDQVWFYGACYDERTNAELIYNSDLCISPGNIGLTAIHVLMFGCPAITNDDFNHQMPEFEAIHDGITGTFFKADNSESLAESIKKWLANHNNDRDKVRRACYDEIDSKWNPHHQIKIFKEVLGVK